MHEGHEPSHRYAALDAHGGTGRRKDAGGTCVLL
jgi:hypothetical protein